MKGRSTFAFFGFVAFMGAIPFGPFLAAQPSEEAAGAMPTASEARFLYLQSDATS